MEILLNLISWISSITITLQGVGILLSIISVFSLLYLLYQVHASPNNKIDLSELIVDTSGKLNDSKLRLNVAWLFTTWSLVFCVLKNQSVEAVLGLYLAAWVTDRYNSRNHDIAVASIKTEVTTIEDKDK